MLRVFILHTTWAAVDVRPVLLGRTDQGDCDGNIDEAAGWPRADAMQKLAWQIVPTLRLLCVEHVHAARVFICTYTKS
jgi:hypothetical protein